MKTALKINKQEKKKTYLKAHQNKQANNKQKEKQPQNKIK